MDLIIEVIILLVGFVLLIKGADYFVDGASNVARILKIPAIIIGLTVVGFGTSAPEAAVSITAALSGSNAIAVSNIVGSNIFNLLFIVGVCAIIKNLKIGRNLLKQDLPFLVIVSALIVVLILINWDITRLEGLFLLVLIILYVSYLVYTAKKSKEAEYIEKPTIGKGRSILYIVAGLIGVIIGGECVVEGASSIAMAMGMSETLVGLTIVAIGTSLPELVTSLTALKRKENQIVIGNIVGSNIFNILFILGLSSLITPIPVSPEMIVDLGLMLGMTILAFIFAKLDSDYNKKEGIILTALFIIYMIFAILRN